jgi:hypothetical protein
MRRLLASGLLVIASNGAQASCDGTTAVHGANFGFYEYNAGTNRWNLIESHYEPRAENEPMIQGDIYRPLSAYDTDGGSNPPNQQQRVGGELQSLSTGCDPVTLPGVEVVGARPSAGHTVMLRFLPVYMGGSGSFNRASRGGVRQSQQDRLTCAHSQEERKLAALAAIPPVVPAESVWLIRYAPGTYQIWVVTVPTASDRGLQPAGRCVGP